MKENKEVEKHSVSMIGMNQDMGYICSIMEDVEESLYIRCFQFK